MLVALGGIVAAMLKAKPEELRQKVGPVIADTIQLTQDWAWLLVPSFLLLAWVIKQVRSWIGDPAVREEVRKRINEYRKEVFTDSAGGAAYQADRRVTLFRRKRVCWSWRCWPWGTNPFRRRFPWDGWLVPEFRSGATPQFSKTCFRVPEGRHREAEGVAGLAWESDGWVHIPDLPDVQNSTRSEADIEAYADATKMFKEDVRKDPPQGRSFAGVRIEVGGKGWGALVIDTRSPILDERLNKRAKDKFNNSFDGLLSILLPRI